MQNNYFNQDTNAWLQSRLGRFTASEIHKLFVGSSKKTELFGKGAMTYILTKAAELLTMEVKDDIDFKQGEWGKANEPDAVMVMEKIIGITGEYYGMANPTFFKQGKYLGCSPDWESIVGEKIGADIKCPYNSAEHVRNLLLKSAADLESERWEYYCQLQMSTMIRSWKKALFFSYDPRIVEFEMNHKLIEVYPDEKWQFEYGKRIPAAIEMLNDIMASQLKVA